MKKFFLLLLPLVILLGCDDDDSYSLGKFWINMATVDNDSNSSAFYLNVDNGKRIWIGATNYPGYRPPTGQRILVNYTILNDKPESSGYDHDAKLNDAYNILTKDVRTLTDNNEDDWGDDPVGISDMWIGGGYLNVEFIYNGYNKTHTINLVYDPEEVYEDGKIHLELRHNAYKDEARYRLNGMVSFNLHSLPALIEINGSAVELVIHTTDFDGNDKTYPFTYKYNEGTNKDFDQDDFDENHETDIN